MQSWRVLGKQMLDYGKTGFGWVAITRSLCQHAKLCFMLPLCLTCLTILLTHPVTGFKLQSAKNTDNPKTVEYSNQIKETSVC